MPSFQPDFTNNSSYPHGLSVLTSDRCVKFSDSKQVLNVKKSDTFYLKTAPGRLGNRTRYTFPPNSARALSAPSKFPESFSAATSSFRPAALWPTFSRAAP